MCTAVLSIQPGLPTLLAGIRDELTARAWLPPARHWPEYPGLIGGKDLLAGGTWLAVAPRERRVSCVLNGRGQPAQASARRSRGVLPLRGAAGQPLNRAELGGYDPFHLLTVDAGRAVMHSWDGLRLAERELGPGLHFVVNSGLADDLPGGTSPAGAAEPDGRELELARIAYFVPLFEAATRPVPLPGESMAGAWGDWFPLVNGAGIEAGDKRALIVRHDLGGGRVYGTTSISLVAFSPTGLRYDFSGLPGDPAAWQQILPGAHDPEG